VLDWSRLPRHVDDPGVGGVCESRLFDWRPKSSEGNSHLMLCALPSWLSALVLWLSISQDGCSLASNTSGKFAFTSSGVLSIAANLPKDRMLPAAASKLGKASC
jgi:hypothetical protein